MRISVLLLPVAMIAVLSGCGANKPADAAAKPADSKPAETKATEPAKTTENADAELTKKLMADGGRWLQKTDDGEVMAVFLPEKIVNVFAGDAKISGSWEIKGGNLIMTLKDEKTVDKIKEISAKEFIYVDGDSQQTVVTTKVKD